VVFRIWAQVLPYASSYEEEFYFCLSESVLELVLTSRKQNLGGHD
jgi:hypothetical protein